MGPNTFTPEFSDVIRQIVDTMISQMWVAMPAKIATYDPQTQYADVQIQLLRGFNDNTTKPYPIIGNVPVKHPRANNGAAYIHMPLEVGDDVTLIFSSRSLDNWKTQGGMSDPADTRKQHLSDAYALIGGSALPDAFEVMDPKAIEITNGQATAQLHPGGTFTITNGTNELLDLINQLSSQVQTLAQTLSTDTVNTIFGPMQLNAFEEYTNQASQLTEISTKLGTLKE